MADQTPDSGLRRIWGNLSPGQRLMVGGTVIAVVIAVVVGGLIVSRAGYSVLYSGLAPEEAGKVLEKLEQRNIPYRIGAGGGTIMVPTGKVHSARIELASDGLPGSGSIGFEIFDKTVFGMTEFLQKVNYRRALEGELSQTIMQMEEVEGVRVHIVVPENALFKEDQQPATASVVLRGNPARALNQRKIEGIAYLVASSVEGLEPDRVTIIDSRGTLLSRGFPDGRGQASDGLELKQKVETYLENKAQTLLDGVLGPGTSVIRISAILNMERIERNVESFDPETAVIRSEERIENAGGDGQSRSETSVTNYEFDRSVESIAAEVGNIERLSVAVMVDGRYETATGRDGKVTRTFIPREDEEIATLAGIVKSAVGFDQERKDYFEIASIAFDRSFLEDQERGMEKMLRMQFYMSLARKGAYLAGLILALVVLMKLVKKTAGIIGSAKRGVDFHAGGPVEPAAGGGISMGQPAGDVASRIASMASSNPDQAAGVISSMVRGGD
jgi:flagellar M-ring protein FliF